MSGFPKGSWIPVGCREEDEWAANRKTASLTDLAISGGLIRHAKGAGLRND